MTFVIREMQSGDCSGVSAILPSLGYEGSPNDIIRRMGALHGWPDQLTLVACSGATVVGFCHAQDVRLLVTDGYAEIHALVVSPSYHRQGIGSALLREATRWGFCRGYSRVRLRSGIHREEAHSFYRSNCFSQTKASYAFELNSATAAD